MTLQSYRLALEIMVCWAFRRRHSTKHYSTATLYSYFSWLLLFCKIPSKCSSGCIYIYRPYIGVRLLFGCWIRDPVESFTFWHLFLGSTFNAFIKSNKNTQEPRLFFIPPDDINFALMALTQTQGTALPGGHRQSKQLNSIIIIQRAGKSHFIFNA